MGAATARAGARGSASSALVHHPCRGPADPGRPSMETRNPRLAWPWRRGRPPRPGAAGQCATGAEARARAGPAPPAPVRRPSGGRVRRCGAAPPAHRGAAAVWGGGGGGRPQLRRPARAVRAPWPWWHGSREGERERESGEEEGVGVGARRRRFRSGGEDCSDGWRQYGPWIA